MEPILRVIEVLGILACAVSGILEARRKQMDLVGMYVAAFVTAFGGGTLRDILLDRRPFFWVEHAEYPVLLVGLCLVAVILRRLGKTVITEPMVNVPDALGLGLFSAAGTSYALQFDWPPFVASLMGVLTGVFGGVIRDIICNEVPKIFQRSPLYATCSFAGCWAYLLLHFNGVIDIVALSACIGVTVVLRLLAVRYAWTLPG